MKPKKYRYNFLTGQEEFYRKRFLAALEMTTSSFKQKAL